jgi:hypothetical protein
MTARGQVISLIMANGWRMTKPLGYAMFVLYALFVLQVMGPANRTARTPGSATL